jgi:heat shock protein HslJ
VRLSSIVQRGSVVSTPIDKDITVEFNAGEIAGFSGCNQYSTRFETADNKLTLGMIMGTLMACEGERGDREKGLLATLTAVQGFEIRRNSLTMFNVVGDPILYFQADTAVES